MRVAVLLALVLLPGCSTVRGWFGIDGDGDDAPDAVVSSASPDARRAQDAEAARRAQEEPIRQEIRRLEADAKSGKVPIRDARKRIDDLRAQLEEIARAPVAPRTGRSREPAAVAQRVSEIEARLARIEEKLAAIEARLAAAGR